MSVRGGKIISRSKCERTLRLLAMVLCLMMAVPFAWSQHGSTGTINVTAVDPSGGVIPGANLELRDLATNDVRKAQTHDNGTYSFVNLSIGKYRLTVTKSGFASQAFDSVVVDAARTTDLQAQLKVGAETQTVEVSASATPIVETRSNAIATTIDMKQIEDLPLGGRDLTSLSQLTPGYTGTWNGLPSVAQGSNIDGVIGSPSRMKFGGNAQPAVSARLEDIEEMTVQTDQLDLNQGFGQANMQINFVTRRGTNRFHGRVFEDFRNSGLNANSWYNDASGLRKDKLILNDFGGSLGGPIIKDKLFFFGTFAMSKQPGGSNAYNDVLTQAAQNGTFQYTGTDGQTHTVNVLQMVHNYNSSLPGTVNAVTGTQLQAINQSLQYGALTPTADPNISQLGWLINSPTTYYYPTVRVDYNASQAIRMNLAWNETKYDQPGVNAPFFPGPTFADQQAGNQSKAYTAAYGLDWTISPTLVNSFKAGFLYNANKYAYDVAQTYANNGQTVAWNLPVPYPFGGNMSGQQYNLPVSTYYPVFNLSDTMTWQKGAHTFNFGFSWYREQDHYWNPPAGFPNITLGLANGDPALQAFTQSSVPNASFAQLSEAEQLYAVLTGRISNVGGQFAYNPSTGTYANSVGAYNLDELQKAWGLFFQDSYRIKPNLTLNYGLRWDFTGDDHDLTGAYHGASPEAIFGPSGVWNVFNPGSLSGTMNPTLNASGHQYHPWNVSPQPAIGIAWAPKFSEGWTGKLLGEDRTVFRAGYSLRRFTEPQQYFWNNASDYGSFFYQNFYLNANSTGTAGTFQPGSLSLGNTLPPYGYAPTQYQAVAPEADYTFLYTVGVNGIDPNIRQPYTQSWNVGIQRQLGKSTALEVRYNGSRTIHQWISLNTNEVNIFENGFLNEFKAAQANLAINTAHGVSGFANNGYAGQQALPIISAAFNGAPGEYTDTTFLNYLATGQAGAFANTLTGLGAAPFFCNLVGSGFTPCATNGGYTGAGAGYPINFFQANPFASNTSVGYMTDSGYSNYNGLQVDLRQRNWHGVQFDANYTWSHTLGVATPNDWTGSIAQFTLRNLDRSYGPTLFDLRHVVHVNATVDLPFGRGRRFANQNGVLDRIVGGWTVGTIFTYQSGAPFRLNGGYLTYNDYADGGINLNGISVSQLQSGVGVYRIPGAAYVNILNPQYISSNGGGANAQYLSPNTTPGTIGNVVYLYGPHQVYDDMSLTKSIPITESVRFRFQAEFLNAFNHPVFGVASNGVAGSYNVQYSNFGTGSVINSARQIELRANIDF